MPYFENHSRRLLVTGSFDIKDHWTDDPNKKIDAVKKICDIADNMQLQNPGLQQGLGEDKVNHVKIEAYGRFNPFNPTDLVVIPSRNLRNWVVFNIREATKKEESDNGTLFVSTNEVTAEQKRIEFCTRIHLRPIVS